MVLAVGNPFRGDDGAGIYAGRLLAGRGVPVVFAETPENVMGRLKGRVIVLDACRGCRPPFELVRDASLPGTHKPNLSSLAEKLGIELVVVGIHGRRFEMFSGLSRDAEENARRAAEFVWNMINTSREGK